MNQKSKISLYLLLLSVVFFLMLSVSMVFNAYSSAQQQFKFTKQYYLSTAFFQSGLDGNELSSLVDTLNNMLAFTNEDLHIDRTIIDSLIKTSASEYTMVEDNFKKLLRNDGINAEFEMTVLVDRFHVKFGDTLIKLYDFNSDSTFLTLFGQPTLFNLNKPDNSFFYQLNEFQMNVQIAVFVHFPGIKIYLLHQIKNLIFISISMLIIFIIIVVYTIHTIRSQQMVDQMKTDFINNMTHELKTPLTTLSVAAKTINPKNVNATSSLITNQVNRLESIINRVMELSTFRQRRLNMELVSIKAFFIDLINTFDDNQTKNKLTYSGVPDKTQMLVDPFLLETAVFNLLDNARKFGRNKEILLEIELNAPWLMITVQDEGEGIPAKYHKYVFKKFYRVPQGNRHEIKGSGLGLFYVNEIAIAHQGKVKLQSELNKGTRVTLLIPLK